MGFASNRPSSACPKALPHAPFQVCTSALAPAFGVVAVQVPFMPIITRYYKEVGLVMASATSAIVSANGYALSTLRQVPLGSRLDVPAVVFIAVGIAGDIRSVIATANNLRSVPAPSRHAGSSVAIALVSPKAASLASLFI